MRIGRVGHTRDKIRSEVDHDNTVSLFDKMKDVIRNIPRMRTYSVRRGVAVNNWRGTAFPVLRCAENIPHRVLTYVGKVDNHTQTVHLVNKFSSSRGYTSPLRLSYLNSAIRKLDESGIRVRVVAVVS